MDLFNFYRHVTESMLNYLFFVGMSFFGYMMFCLFVNFVTECIIKIVFSYRVSMADEDKPKDPWVK